MRRAIFIDRDGTLNEEIGHVREVDQLRLIAGSAEAVRRINRAGLQTVVVTNQSGVARGLLDEDRLAEIHDRLRELLLEHDARLDGIYHCPHHPEGSSARFALRCDCRKPAPGLLRRASEEMGIRLDRSYIVGDHRRDLAAGRAAGAVPVLVLTGRGREQRDAGFEEAEAPRFVAADLAEAVGWILERESTGSAGTPGRRDPA